MSNTTVEDSVQALLIISDIALPCSNMGNKSLSKHNTVNDLFCVENNGTV